VTDAFSPDSGSRQLPPVPEWRPDFCQPLDELAERLSFYTNGANDFAVFQHGTLAVLPGGLEEVAAAAHACAALDAVFNAHPDMHPLAMEDGNIVIQYSHNVLNIVLAGVAQAHQQEIDARHLLALATDEVLITPDGPNRFDAFGRQALFGRCYMFMDAQQPEVVRIVRATAGR